MGSENGLQESGPDKEVKVNSFWAESLQKTKQLELETKYTGIAAMLAPLRAQTSADNEYSRTRSQSTSSPKLLTTATSSVLTPSESSESRGSPSESVPFQKTLCSQSSSSDDCGDTTTDSHVNAQIESMEGHSSLASYSHHHHHQLPPLHLPPAPGSQSHQQNQHHHQFQQGYQDFQNPHQFYQPPQQYGGPQSSSSTSTVTYENFGEPSTSSGGGGAYQNDGSQNNQYHNGHAGPSGHPPPNQNYDLAPLNSVRYEQLPPQSAPPLSRNHVPQYPVKVLDPSQVHYGGGGGHIQRSMSTGGGHQPSHPSHLKPAPLSHQSSSANLIPPITSAPPPSSAPPSAAGGSQKTPPTSMKKVPDPQEQQRVNIAVAKNVTEILTKNGMKQTHEVVYCPPRSAPLAPLSLQKPPSFQCPNCNRNLKTAKNLQSHKQTCGQTQTIISSTALPPLPQRAPSSTQGQAPKLAAMLTSPAPSHSAPPMAPSTSAGVVTSPTSSGNFTPLSSGGPQSFQSPPGTFLHHHNSTGSNGYGSNQNRHLYSPQDTMIDPNVMLSDTFDFKDDPMLYPGPSGLQPDSMWSRDDSFPSEPQSAVDHMDMDPLFHDDSFGRDLHDPLLSAGSLGPDPLHDPLQDLGPLDSFSDIMKPEYSSMEFTEYQHQTDFSNSEFSNPGSNNKFYGTLEHDMRKSMEQPVEEQVRSDSVSQSSSSQRSTTPVTKFAFSCVACTKGVSSDRSLRRHYTTCIKYKEMLAAELATLPPGAQSKLAPKKRAPGGGGGKRTAQKKKEEAPLENKPPEEKNSAIVAALETKKKPPTSNYPVQAPPPPAFHNPYQSVGALPSLNSSWFGGSSAPSTSTSILPSPSVPSAVGTEKSLDAPPTIPKNTSQLKLLIDEDDGDSRSSSGTERKSSNMFVCEKCSKPLCSMSNLKRHRQTCKAIPVHPQEPSLSKKTPAPGTGTQAPPTPSHAPTKAPPAPARVTQLPAPPNMQAPHSMPQQTTTPVLVSIAPTSLAPQAPPPMIRTSPPLETTAVVMYCQSYTKSPEKHPMVSPNKKVSSVADECQPLSKEPTVGESLRAQLHQRSHNKSHLQPNFATASAALDPQQVVSFQQRYINTTRSTPLTSMAPRFPNPILNQDQNPPRQHHQNQSNQNPMISRQAPPTPAQIQHTPMPQRHHSPQIKKGVIEHKNTDLVLITSEPLAEKKSSGVQGGPPGPPGTSENFQDPKRRVSEPQIVSQPLPSLQLRALGPSDTQRPGQTSGPTTNTVAYQVQYSGRPLPNQNSQMTSQIQNPQSSNQMGGHQNSQNPPHQMMMMPQGLQNPPPPRQMNMSQNSNQMSFQNPSSQNQQYQQMPQNPRPNQNQMTFQTATNHQNPQNPQNPPPPSPKLSVGQLKLLQIQQKRVFTTAGVSQSAPLTVTQAPPTLAPQAKKAQNMVGQNPNQKEMLTILDDVKDEEPSSTQSTVNTKKTPGSPLDSIITSVPLSVEVHHHHHLMAKTPLALTDSQGLSSVDSSAADDNSPPGSSRSQSRLIPYVCPECDKIYSCRKNVKRHRMAVHKMSLEEVLANPEHPAPPDAVLTCHISGRRHTVAGMESGSVAPKSRKRKASAAVNTFGGKKGKEVKKLEETEDESDVEDVAGIDDDEEIEELEDIKEVEEKPYAESQMQEIPKLRPSAFPSVSTILPKNPSSLNSKGPNQHHSFQNFGPLPPASNRPWGQRDDAWAPMRRDSTIGDVMEAQNFSRPEDMEQNRMTRKESMQSFGAPTPQTQNPVQNPAPLEHFQSPRTQIPAQNQNSQNQAPMNHNFGPSPPRAQNQNQSQMDLSQNQIPQSFGQSQIPNSSTHSKIMSSRIQNQDSTITYTPIPTLPNRNPNLQSPPPPNQNPRLQSPPMQNQNPMLQSPPLQRSDPSSQKTSPIENTASILSPTSNQIQNLMTYPRPAQMNLGRDQQNPIESNSMIPRVQSLLPSIQNLRSQNPMTPEPLLSPTNSTPVDQTSRQETPPSAARSTPFQAPPLHQTPPPFYQTPPPTSHMPWMQPEAPIVPHPSWGLPPSQDFHIAPPLAPPPLAPPPLQAPPPFNSNGWVSPYPPPSSHMDTSWAPVPMTPQVPITSSEVATSSEESAEPPRRSSAEEDSRAMAKIAAELKRFAEIDSGKSMPAEIQKQPQEDSEYDAHLFQTIREEYRQSTEEVAFQKEEDQQKAEMFQYPISRESASVDSTFVEAPPLSTSSSLPSSSLPSSLASPEIHGLPIPNTTDQKPTPAKRSGGSRKPRPRSQNLACTGCGKMLGSDYALRRHRMSCAEVQKQRNPEYPKPPKRRQPRTHLDMDQEELQSEEETPVEIVKGKRKRMSKIAEMSKEERERLCADAERRMFEAEREIEMMEAMPAPSVVMDTVDELQMERDAMNLHKSPPTTNVAFTSAEPTNLHNTAYFSTSSTNTSSRESSTSVSPPSKIPSGLTSSETSSNFATPSESVVSSGTTSTAPSAGVEKSLKQAKHMCQECVKSLCSAYGLKRHNITCPSAQDEKFYEPTSPEDHIDVLFKKDDAWGMMSFGLLQKISGFFVLNIKDGEPNRRLALETRWSDFRQFLEVHEKIARVTADNVELVAEQSVLYECDQVSQMVETYKSRTKGEIHTNSL